MGAVDEDWGVVGHSWAVRLLRRAVERDELSHAYLLTGAPGVGKMTLARALAAAVLCTGQPRPCGACRSCRLVASGNHPDLHLVAPASRAGWLQIDQVRELRRQLALTPHSAQRRVAILEQFERAAPAAANAFLKTLEEPPDYVLLILLAPDTDSLLPTIVSRCQVIPLRPLAAGEIERALVARWGVEAERARLLARLCGGRIGWAVQAAAEPAVLERRQKRLDELMALERAALVERFAYAEAMSVDIESASETLELWALWWRDVMLLASGVEDSLANVDRRELLEEQAFWLGAQKAAELVHATRAAVDNLRRNVNPRLALETLLAYDLPRR
jgi:DNA polymerase-3 subunit delta'